MKACFWVVNKQCPYLKQEDEEENPFKTINRKDIPMLQHFEIKEICQLCLMATKISLRRI